jgi:phosphoesterase RecJ-like protein
VAEVLRRHQSFVLITHVRPDGDAIGSQLALAWSLEELGKRVLCWNEDGLPDNLRFLPGSERVTRPPTAPVEVDVVVALDTATRPRLGERCLAAAAAAGLWLNIDHHKSNPGYGHVNLIDPGSPATGEILYDLIVSQGLPFPAPTRDAIYVAVSTDTGSFQYASTTARTYEMAADLVRRGLDVGRINALTYDSHPWRRIELMRSLLNTLELAGGGLVAHWELSLATRQALGLKPEDSEGLIDLIRAIEGVVVAVFFEELEGGKVRVSMRSKDPRVDVCHVCSVFGGGGHAMAAGIRMAGPLAEARAKVLAAVEEELKNRIQGHNDEKGL